MNNNIKEAIESIQIPLELRQRSELGIQQAKLENKGHRPTARRLISRNRLAASVFVLILLSSVVFSITKYSQLFRKFCSIFLVQGL